MHTIFTVMTNDAEKCVIKITMARFVPIELQFSSRYVSTVSTRCFLQFFVADKCSQ